MRVAILLLLCLASSAAARAQPAAPLDTDLAGLIAHLDRLRGELERATEPQNASILVRLPSAFRVRHGGQTFDVPFEDVAQRLLHNPSGASWEGRRAAALARIAAIRAEAAAFPSGARTGADAAARERLQAILADREFSRRDGTSWMEELRRRLLEWIAGLLDAVGGGPVPGRTIALGAAWLAALAALAGLGWWLYREGAERMRPAGLRVVPAGSAPASSREWGLRAIAALRDGQSQEAVRCAYRAAVRRGEEQGAWKPDGSRTPREHVRLIRPDDRRHDPFTHIARLVERVIYGRRDLAADDGDRLGDDLEKLGCVRTADRSI